MIRERVNKVLIDWCGTSPDDQETSLETLWIATRNSSRAPHNGIDFQPDGVRDLLIKLDSEFSKPGNERKNVLVLTAASFKPSGTIEGVDHLVAAVVACPNLPPTT